MKAGNVLAGLGALLVFVAVATYGLRTHAGETRALAESRAARQAVARATVFYEQKLQASDSALAVATRKVQAAQVRHARVDTLRVAFEEAAAAAPDTCAAVIASATAALDTARAENADLIAANAGLSFAYLVLRAGANVLADSTAVLVQKTEKLERVVAGRKWYLPQGIFITPGVGPRGFTVAIGPSWRLF